MLRTIVQQCISMATLISAHGTTILTNHEPFELVKVCLLCPPGKNTDYIIKMAIYKLLFVV